jgi:hypothetical protein
MPQDPSGIYFTEQSWQIDVSTETTAEAQSHFQDLQDSQMRYALTGALPMSASASPESFLYS